VHRDEALCAAGARRTFYRWGKAGANGNIIDPREASLHRRQVRPSGAGQQRDEHGPGPSRFQFGFPRWALAPFIDSDDARIVNVMMMTFHAIVVMRLAVMMPVSMVRGVVLVVHVEMQGTAHIEIERGQRLERHEHDDQPENGAGAPDAGYCRGTHRPDSRELYITL
jgi:hypothetical protein